jgi:hypothetical protein
LRGHGAERSAPSTRRRAQALPRRSPSQSAQKQTKLASASRYARPARLPDGRGLAPDAIHSIQGFAFAFFIPIYFAIVGLQLRITPAIGITPVPPLVG